MKIPHCLLHIALGDAYAAAFLHATLAGADVDQAMHAAAEHAATACAQFGAWSQEPGR